MLAQTDDFIKSQKNLSEEKKEILNSKLEDWTSYQTQIKFEEQVSTVQNSYFLKDGPLMIKNDYEGSVFCIKNGEEEILFEIGYTPVGDAMYFDGKIFVHVKDKVDKLAKYDLLSKSLEFY